MIFNNRHHICSRQLVMHSAVLKVRENTKFKFEYTITCLTCFLFAVELNLFDNAGIS